MGRVTGEDQLPTKAPLPELLTVTVIGVDVAFRPAELYATAARVCVPLRLDRVQVSS